MGAELTPEVEACFDAVRRWEPRVRALIGYDEAAARQRARAACLGPLHGWALGIKDIFDLQGFPTRCNAEFTRAGLVATSAASAERLLSLGCFVLSKVVTTTFAYLDPGPTCNPWNTAHTPGGSSSGSAAAVACGMVRLALGTQTVGSINRPASYCGVVGFKPTYGRIPTRGVFPFAPSVDTVGFFTRDAADMQTAFSAFTAQPIAAAPATLRIGLIEDCRTAPPDEEMAAALRNVAEKLRIAGFDVRPAELPVECGEARDHHFALIAAEAAVSHRELFAEFAPRYPPGLSELIRRGQQIPADQLRRIDEHRRRTAEKIGVLMNEFDLLLTPSAPGPAPRTIASTGDPRFNLIWTYTGYPSLTLPAELSRDGLPLGVQFSAGKLRDEMLLAAGRRIEATLNIGARLR